MHATEDVDMDTTVVDNVQETCSDDVRPSYWDWICLGWAKIADSLLGRVAFRVFIFLYCRFIWLMRAMKVDENGHYLDI